jgi:hypothetical protein
MKRSAPGRTSAGPPIGAIPDRRSMRKRRPNSSTSHFGSDGITP